MKVKVSVLCAIAAVASLIGSTAVNAATVVTATANIAPDGGAVHDPYDPATDTPGSGPMMTASSTDLAQGLTEAGGGVSITDNDNIEESFGVDATTDGSLATVYIESGPGGDAVDHAAYATAPTNSLLTYNLGGLYDLSQVDIYGGWNDSGRDALSFDLQVSADDALYTTIASYTKGPDDTGQITVPVTNLYSVVDDGGANIASAVQYVRVSVTDADNGYVGIAEVDVFGTRVPEPTSVALVAFTCLATIASQRRR